MEKYSIKVNIMNRPYPLLVKAEEEEAVRRAAKMINDRIKQYKDQFSVQDELDLAIMCCLELATDNINQAGKARDGESLLMEKAERLDNALNASILNTEEVPRSS